MDWTHNGVDTQYDGMTYNGKIHDEVDIQWRDTRWSGHDGVDRME